MVLAVWQSTIVDNVGDVQAGATITVSRETGGFPAATLYSDRDGSVPLANPFVADGNGFAQFFAAGGAHRIVVTKGSFSKTYRYVAIGTLAERDVGELFHIDTIPDTMTRAIDIYQDNDVTNYQSLLGGDEADTPPVAWSHNRILIDDNIGGITDADYQIYGAYVLHSLVGSKVDGPRTAFMGMMHLSADSDPTSVLPFYCGVGGVSILDANAGGSAPDGNGFGEGLYGATIVGAGGTYQSGIAGGEFFSSILNPGGSELKMGVLISSGGAADLVRGELLDAQLVISLLASSVKRDYGIVFGNFSGQHPVDGTLLKTLGSATLHRGLDFSSYTFDEYFLYFGASFGVTSTGIMTLPFWSAPNNGGILGPTTAAQKFSLFAYDVDGAAYVSLLNITSANTPLLDITVPLHMPNNTPIRMRNAANNAYIDAVTMTSGDQLLLVGNNGIVAAGTLIPLVTGSYDIGSSANKYLNLNVTNINIGATPVNIFTGANTPEGAVTAPIGSLFLRNNGSTTTTLYVKTSGSGNTGWTAK